MKNNRGKNDPNFSQAIAPVEGSAQKRGEEKRRLDEEIILAGSSPPVRLISALIEEKKGEEDLYDHQG